MEPAKNRYEVQHELESKAAESLVYRKELMKDPKKMLALALDAPIPEHVNVRLVEEDQNTLYLVLRFPDEVETEGLVVLQTPEDEGVLSIEEAVDPSQHFSLSACFGTEYQGVVEENISTHGLEHR